MQKGNLAFICVCVAQILFSLVFLGVSAIVGYDPNFLFSRKGFPRKNRVSCSILFSHYLLTSG
jgi:hypothetical protein